MKDIRLIPYNCGWGASDRGCADGPSVLKKRGLHTQLSNLGIRTQWAKFLYSELEPKDLEAPQGRMSLPLVEDYCHLLHGQVTATLAAGEFPVSIGGDHSMAIGTWAAVADHYQNHGKLGLIWVDAHMDAHPSVESSASTSYHGTPAGLLLGSGDKALLELAAEHPVLSPEHLCIIGVRSYEPPEELFLQKLGVRLYRMPEIRERGLGSVMQEALATVTKGTDGFGITVDLDAFDPSRAPGVGSPVEDGLMHGETLDALAGLGTRKDCLALEIAEYNPHHGKGGITTALVRDIIASVMS